MKIYNHFIPPTHYNIKYAQIVPEQSLDESITVYSEAIPYIECQIQSTIQHEAGHRKDEENRYEDIENNQRVIPFDQFTSKGRAEGIAESKEERCDGLYPSEISGNTETVSLQSLFETAKNKSNIDPSYVQDIKAGHLNPDAQGMYLMQDIPFQLKVKPTSNPNLYEGFDGTLWIDIRKIAAPFIVQETGIGSKPSTFQDDGMFPDIPFISQQQPTSNSIPAGPSVPTVPSIGAR